MSLKSKGIMLHVGQGIFMRAIAVVFFALCLAGCGIAREREQEAQYKAAIDACGQMSAGPVRWAQCQTDAENKYLEALKNSRYSDLLTLKQAKRAEIASRLERKQITVEQANVELATMNSQIVSEATTRQTAIASASAQQSAAAAAQSAAATASWNAMQASMPRPPVTCLRTGNMVTCN